MKRRDPKNYTNSLDSKVKELNNSQSQSSSNTLESDLYN